MKQVKYLILGAGPAGLSFASRLLKNGETDFLIIEKENTPGGLCRSEYADGKPIDIGGGHFLDAGNSEVCDFAFSFLPKSEWDKYERDSRINMGDYTIGSPIEANIWQMPEAIQKAYLDAIADAGCNMNMPKPDKFVDWIYWKLGHRIADDYMLPYNRKMFGDELNSLGTYWLEKLPNVSYEETLLSCKNHRPYGRQPGHAFFYYPHSYGFGELWLRVAASLGNRIVYNTPVTSLDVSSKIINDSFKADVIICTIPYTSLENIKGLSAPNLNSIDSLKSTGVVINYCPDNIETDAQWIYYPNPDLNYHRILVRHNFCPDSNGYWTETRLDRFDTNTDSFYYVNEFAYPLNTTDKPTIIASILDELKANDIYGLGRWGEWEHYNSDVVAKRAFALADSFTR